MSGSSLLDGGVHLAAALQHVFFDGVAGDQLVGGAPPCRPMRWARSVACASDRGIPPHGSK